MPKLNKLEAYEIMKIHRSQIKNAPYNPRKITAAAEKNLRKSLKDFGIMAPITWNRTTGNIVGGNTRTKAMDSILRTEDYELTVAVVEMELEQEVKANIVLNNPAAQGEWDEELLAEIKIEFPDMDFEKDLMFEKFDIDMIFSGTELAEEMVQAFAPQEEIKSDIDKLRDIDNIKAAKKKHREDVKDGNTEGDSYQIDDDDYMVTFVFPNNSEKADFLKLIAEKPTEKYIKHTKLFDIQDGKYKAYDPFHDQAGE